ncbi:MULTISPECIES: 3-coathanger stack domain-containing protein [Empedobacter]|uniref:T9SS type A sorting domain-containing protein n=2 Tax=Pseudomonadati TaxID=3379134 RepID=A0A7H9DX45_9FLAO|nr:MULTISPECIES: 3-coathanger stack domain-containing protein [Empedobacter]MDH2207367.1 T9SS type A sorting domain-containing protein [Empedobacter sp. GD03644]QLL59690.1 T9SS type A sorting domain-containing protein [Empedobacter falsenii]
MKKLFSFLLLLLIFKVYSQVTIGNKSDVISYGQTGFVEIVFSNNRFPSNMGANIHPVSTDNGYTGKFPEGTQAVQPGGQVKITLGFKHTFTTPRVTEYKFKAIYGYVTAQGQNITEEKIISIQINYTSNNIPCSLPIPTNLQNYNITDSQANFSWNSVSGANDYEILLTTPNGTKSFSSTTNNRLIIDLAPNTTYSWKVAAKCSNGIRGTFSAEKTFITAPFICQDVMNITNPIINSKEYKSRNIINASAPINENLNVIFRSNSIFLKPGFNAKSKFRAYIKPCTKDNEFISLENEELTAYIGMGEDMISISNNLSYQNTFTISPNPTSNFVQINSTVGINEWFVYDINAKVVVSGNNKNATALKVNLQTLPAGLYYFKFVDDLGTINEKTIIKK